MKHLLIIFPHLRNRKEFGGQRSRHIISSLSRSGYLSTVIIPGKDSMTGIEKTRFGFFQFWKREKGVGNTEVIYANSTRNDRASFSRRILYFITTGVSVFFAAISVKKTDVVICVSLPVTFMMIGRFISAIRRVPYVIEVRDIGVSVAHEINVVKKTWLFNVVFRVETYLYKSADVIIAVSDGFKDRLIERGVLADNIQVVKLGFDGYEDMVTDSKTDLSSLKGKFVVLYSGTLGHVFNIPLVIDAAYKLIDYEDVLFVFLGGGQNLERYASLSEKKGLNAVFLGNRPKYEVSDYCSRADLCLYPAKDGVNINAMLGNKIFDYLGNGSACIYAGPGGDVADLIVESGGGLVCEGSPDELAAAILRMYNDRSQCAEMGDKAREYVNKEYRSNLMAEKFVSVIDEI